jgi:fructokinase
MRVLDVNLRQNYFSREVIEQSLALANVLKINDNELPLIAEMFALTGDARERLAQMAERFDLRMVACTRGEHGSLLLSDGRYSDHPGIPATIADTVGAGDSFTAAMILGLLAGWDLDQVNEQANRVAAYVASRPGATPDLPEYLRAVFQARPSRMHNEKGPGVPGPCVKF